MADSFDNAAVMSWLGLPDGKCKFGIWKRNYGGRGKTKRPPGKGCLQRAAKLDRIGGFTLRSAEEPSDIAKLPAHPASVQRIAPAQRSTSPTKVDSPANAPASFHHGQNIAATATCSAAPLASNDAANVADSGRIARITTTAW